MSGPRIRFESETLCAVDGTDVVIVRRAWSDAAITYGVQLPDGTELADEDSYSFPTIEDIRNLLAHHHNQSEGQ